MDPDPDAGSTAVTRRPIRPALRVAMARRVLAREGCDTGIAQHVSERDDNDLVWVSPLEFGEICRAEDVAAFALDGSADGSNSRDARRYAADYIELYRRRSDVRAVVHAHSFWVMVLCALGQEIGMYNSTASLLHERQVTWSDQIDPDRTRGERVADALGDREVLLMKNHGVVIASSSIERATVLACVVEQQARLHLEASERGADEMSPAHLRSTKAAHERAYVELSWAAHVRRLRHTDPDLFHPGRPEPRLQKDQR